MKKKIAKKTVVKSVGKPSVGIDMLWFKARFNELRTDHKVIVSLLNGGNVSDKLAAEIRLATAKGKTIDRKVTDLKTEE